MPLKGEQTQSNKCLYKYGYAGFSTSFLVLCTFHHMMPICCIAAVCNAKMEEANVTPQHGLGKRNVPKN